MTKQITIRGVTPELTERLNVLKSESHQSLNSMILSILQEATGLNDRRQRLARYTTWTKKDMKEFQESLSLQRTIDEKLWK